MSEVLPRLHLSYRGPHPVASLQLASTKKTIKKVFDDMCIGSSHDSEVSFQFPAFNSSHLNTNFHRFVPTTRAPGMESANNGSVLTWT